MGGDKGEGEIFVTATSTLWSKALYSTGQALPPAFAEAASRRQASKGEGNESRKKCYPALLFTVW